MGRTKTIGDDEIVSRAREVFRAGGHSASTRDIARAAGISQAVLYQRFGSKEELFFRAMRPEIPDLDGLLGTYPPRNVRTDLGRIADRLVEYLGSLLPTLLQAHTQPDLGGERLLKLHEGLAFHPLAHALTERFERLRDDGLVKAVDPAASARAFLGVVHSAAFFNVMTHGAPPRNRVQVDALVEVLWSGLAPDRSHAVKPTNRAVPARGRNTRRD